MTITGPGRPREFVDPVKVRLQVERSDKDAYTAAARTAGVPLTAWIRRALATHLATHTDEDQETQP